MPIIDLRSDTVTHPTLEMRKAMYEAELGDDVYGEDPTVSKLEELAAKLTDKEAGLFVASGTMGNLVSLLSHCGRGDEVLLGHQSHIHIHEQGGVAALGSIHTRTITNQSDGTMSVQELEQGINENDIHCARTKLICLENTWHGRVLSLDYMEQVQQLAKKHQLKIHLDGARIFNAAVELNVPVKTITQYADTIQFCLSKGLSCPAGSMVCGSTEFIQKARRARKAVGGGMRQAGVLAACGLIALETMVERLAEDHANAKLLADELAQIPEIKVRYAGTNMVFFSSNIASLDDRQLAVLLKEQELLVFDEPLGIRAVIHYGISHKQIKESIARISKAVKIFHEKKTSRHLN